MTIHNNRFLLNFTSSIPLVAGCHGIPTPISATRRRYAQPGHTHEIIRKHTYARKNPVSDSEWRGLNEMRSIRNGTRSASVRT